MNTLLLFLSVAFAQASPIALEHQTCAADQDCAIVVLHGHCMYCARGDDLKNGEVDAVNVSHAKAYEKLSELTEAQRKACATAGPCAQSGKSAAVCRAKRCTVEYVPNR